MATATTVRKSRGKKNEQKSQPKIYTFEWKGLNRDGKKTAGELRGATAAEIRSQLKSQGVNPKSVRKQSSPLFKLGDASITPMDIAMMTRQIATMLAAGVPLVTTIELLGRGHEKAKMRELLANILSEIQSGIPLSDAMRPHRRYFDELYVDLVAAGEHSGSLDLVFDRVATYREKRKHSNQKLRRQCSIQPLLSSSRY
ncbi:hypothetical protein LFREDSHE_43670 [Shewanella baltica]